MVAQGSTDKAEEGLYKNTIFSLLDILGFGDLVEESVGNPSQVREIYSLLTKAVELAGVWEKNRRMRRLKPKFHCFSDTIIVSSPFVSDDTVNAMVAFVTSYQYIMLQDKGAFFRGAIA